MASTQGVNKYRMEACADIMNLLNTYETKLIDKSSLYKKIMEMRY